MKNKYRNRKITIDGIKFDSMKEYRRFCELSLLEKAGKITNLERQVKFELTPKQKDSETGKVIERACNYIADFAYFENGKYVVEDTKGYKTKDYIVKRKVMLDKFGIRIREV